MSKISADRLNAAIKAILEGATTNKRNFLETIELQIGLKNYDTQKDKRFSGSYRLPNVCRPGLKVCIIADAKHADIAAAAKVESISLDELKKFNKQKKPIKKWASQYDALLATDSLIKQLPKIVGPILNKINKFPTAVAYSDDLGDKVAEIKSTVKFQLKKVLCMGVACGNVSMPADEVRRHIVLSVNFLVSLLKKGWQNIRSLHIKSSMGESHRIY